MEYITKNLGLNLEEDELIDENEECFLNIEEIKKVILEDFVNNDVESEEEEKKRENECQKFEGKKCSLNSIEDTLKTLKDIERVCCEKGIRIEVSQIKFEQNWRKGLSKKDTYKNQRKKKKHQEPILRKFKELIKN